MDNPQRALSETQIRNLTPRAFIAYYEEAVYQVRTARSLSGPWWDAWNNCKKVLKERLGFTDDYSRPTQGDEAH